MSHSRFAMRLEYFEAVIDLIPVHNIPPSREILRAAILIFQIVRMLPDIIAHDREQTLGNRIVLIGRADDLEFAIRFSG